MIQTIKYKTAIKKKKKKHMHFGIQIQPCVTQMYLSSDEWQDVHLSRLALLHRGDNETGATQDDLSSGPAIDR